LVSGEVGGQVVGIADGFEEGAESVVVLLGEGIILVIVATAAREAEAEEGSACGLNQISHELGSAAGLFVEQGGRIVLGPETEEAGCDQGILLCEGGRGTRDEFIPGEVLSNELIERFVGVEGSNDIIPKPPCLRTKLIPVEPVTIAVTNDVQPLSGGLLPVGWGCKELV